MRIYLLPLIFGLSFIANATEKVSNSFYREVSPAKVVSLGEIFSIRLPVSLSTGYSWIVRSLPPQVALTGMAYSPPKPGLCLPGCSGSTILYLKAISPGEGILKLQYARIWEKLPKQVHITAINVLTKQDMNRKTKR
ncbi:TPA: protease inhibitor I42 family protein [Klebsiella aerogenes]|nr:protease inhibitor I42 family protein [Klebsiella aerogenes]